MTIDKIIFRTQKDKMLLDYHDGAMATAVGEYLQESGIKDPTRFRFGGDKAIAAVKKIKDERAKAVKDKKPAKIAAPYVQLGMVGKDLVIQIKDNASSKFEENTVMMKGFLDEVETEKSKSVAVVNISHDKEESIIKKSTEAQSKLYKTPVTTEDTTDFGEITGNIVLTAHGRPKVLPGKIIGEALGRKSPQQIVDILTASKEKAKRIPKSYDGVITLSGCFTAAGGPEGEKEDPVFAKQVLSLLIAKGYEHVRVVGYPGSSTTANTKGKDQYGTDRAVGEEASWHAMEDDAKAIQAFQLRIDANEDKLDQAFDKWGGTEDDFVKLPKVMEIQALIDKDAEDIERLVKQQRTVGDDPKAINASKYIANMHGYFGPAKYKTKPWYKKLFG